MSATFKIEVYVPSDHCENLKRALFAAGAGRLGNYDCCAWQTAAGTGQFRPLAGSKPFVGKHGEIEKVDEIKIEIICAEENLDNVITALRACHPYETPAFQYWRVNAAFGTED